MTTSVIPVLRSLIHSAISVPVSVLLGSSSIQAGGRLYISKRKAFTPFLLSLSGLTSISVWDLACRYAKKWKTVSVVWDSWLHDNAQSQLYKDNEAEHAVPDQKSCVLYLPTSLSSSNTELLRPVLRTLAQHCVVVYGCAPSGHFYFYYLSLLSLLFPI